MAGAQLFETMAQHRLFAVVQLAILHCLHFIKPSYDPEYPKSDLKPEFYICLFHPQKHHSSRQSAKRSTAGFT